MKTTVRVLLAVAIAFLAYICVNSVVTPINFENTRAEREVAVVEHLVDLRIAMNEYRLQNGRYTASLDSLMMFLKDGSKKEVVKEGALTDKQLEAGLTELKAVRMIEKAEKTGNWKEVEANGLRGFKRDTISTPLIPALYKDKYTAETIEKMAVIPYTDGVKYEVVVNDNYFTSQGIHVPLVMVRAHYDTYMGDQDAQERVNLIDKEEKLSHYPGLCFGSEFEPNNNAGNWE